MALFIPLSTVLLPGEPTVLARFVEEVGGTYDSAERCVKSTADLFEDWECARLRAMNAEHFTLPHEMHNSRELFLKVLTVLDIPLTMLEEAQEMIRRLEANDSQHLLFSNDTY